MIQSSLQPSAPHFLGQSENHSAAKSSIYQFSTIGLRSIYSWFWYSGFNLSLSYKISKKINSCGNKIRKVLIRFYGHNNIRKHIRVFKHHFVLVGSWLTCFHVNAVNGFHRQTRGQQLPNLWYNIIPLLCTSFVHRHTWAWMPSWFQYLDLFTCLHSKLGFFNLQVTESGLYYCRERLCCVVSKSAGKDLD